MTQDLDTTIDARGAAIDVNNAADLQAQLAEAQLLLAETRLRCTRLLEAARVEANEMIEDARASARRIIADAQGQVTGVDLRPRSSSTFSELWALAADDDQAESFFLEIPARQAVDIFKS